MNEVKIVPLVEDRDDDEDATVIAVAILKWGEAREVVTLDKPARHADLIRKAALLSSDIRCEGFLLSNGSFVNRAYAKVIAKMQGQLLPDAGKHSELLSDEVW